MENKQFLSLFSPLVIFYVLPSPFQSRTMPCVFGIPCARVGLLSNCLYLIHYPHTPFHFHAAKHPPVYPAFHLHSLPFPGGDVCLSCPFTFVTTCPLLPNRFSLLPAYSIWKPGRMMMSELFEGSLLYIGKIPSEYLSTYQPRCEFIGWGWELHDFRICRSSQLFKLSFWHLFWVLSSSFERLGFLNK